MRVAQVHLLTSNPMSQLSHFKSKASYQYFAARPLPAVGCNLVFFQLLLFARGKH
jgi:hypothetical protein